MQAHPFLLFATAAGSLSVLEVGLVRDELPATIATAQPKEISILCPVSGLSLHRKLAESHTG